MANSFKKLIFVFIAVLVLVGILLVAYKSGTTSSKVNRLESPVAKVTPAVSKTVKEQVHSPDGKLNLIMEKTMKENGETDYSFFISDIPETNKRLVFNKTLAKGEMSVPKNTWSPDNNYFFLKENDDLTTTFLVFKASGEKFSGEQQYLDVFSLFAQRKIQYDFKEVTGWDSETLLHVTTNGPNFWFEVPSKSFIQLAR